MTKDTLQIPVDWEIKELKSKYLTLERNLSNNKYVMRYRVNKQYVPHEMIRIPLNLFSRVEF